MKFSPFQAHLKKYHVILGHTVMSQVPIIITTAQIVILATTVTLLRVGHHLESVILVITVQEGQKFPHNMPQNLVSLY